MNNETPNKIIIHGVHRSGTSLTANIISEKGAWYADPPQRMPAQPDNPRGFWERVDVSQINDDILSDCNLSWCSLQRCIPEESIDSLKKKYNNQIKAVNEAQNRHPVSFLKEPRFAFTWPVWQSLIDGKLHHIVVSRHPQAVAQSLLKRNGIPIPVGLTFWTHQTIAIYRTLQNENTVCHLVFSPSKSSVAMMAEKATEFIEVQNIPLRGHPTELFTNLFDSNLVQNKIEFGSLPPGFEGTLDLWEKIQSNRHSEIDLGLQINPQVLGWGNLDSISNNVLHAEQISGKYNEIVSDMSSQISNQMEDAQRKYLELYRNIEKFKYSKGFKITKKLTALANGLKGSSPSALDHVSSLLSEELELVDAINESNRNEEAKKLLLAIRANPGLFIRKLSLSRILAGLKILAGKKPDSLNMDQVLSNYATIPIRLQLKKSLINENISLQQIHFDEIDNPRISIVIPVFNQFQTTLKCLKSIELYTSKELSFEVIVADDCSTDDTSLIRDTIGIKYVRAPENVGFLGNCNHACNAASGHYIVLLNNDTNVQPGWLDNLYKVLEQNSQVGVAGPMFVYPDGVLQEAGGIIFQDASGWNYGRGDNPHKPEYLFTREVDYISGACLMFRRTDWKQIGGFDSRFTPAYYEDTDFCFSMRQLGKSVLYVPSSMVVHFEGISHGTDETSGVKQYQTINQQAFLSKWKEVLDQNHELDSTTLFRARNYGRDSKSILVIDHYVPMQDKDAGSRSTSMYLQLFKDAGMNVTFVGDNFYPHQPYTTELQAMGIEVLYGDENRESFDIWLKQNIRFFDVVYIHRPHIATKYLDKLRKLPDCPRIVYFGHDLHYLRLQREKELGMPNNTGLSINKWKELEFRVMQRSDVVLYPSQFEIDTVVKENEDIKVGVIPLNWFDNTIDYVDQDPVKSAEILFVGGFGHPPNIDALKWFLSSIFPKIIKQIPFARLIVIGSHCPDEVYAYQNESIDILGEVSEAQLEQSYQNARVCVVPLRYGAGVKGKIIEAMAKRKPVVTTPIGAEGILPPSASSGEFTGFLKITEEPDQFADSTIELLENDTSYNDQVRLASLVINKYFSKDSAKVIFSHFFD